MAGFLAGVIGVCIGSFLNVLIDRLPCGQSIMGRSRCDLCRKKLRWFELVPIFSFIIQRGRCRRCKKRLSWQYPFVEVVTGMLFYILSMVLPFPREAAVFPFIQYGAWFVAVSVLFAIIVADFKYFIIPDSLLIVLFLAAGVSIVPIGLHEGLIRLFTGVVAGGVFFGLWGVTRGKGIGFGDVKLVSVMAIVLGFPAIIVALYTAFLTGALYGVILMITGRAGMKSRVAFGPFLLVGGFVALLWSKQILLYWGYI